MSLIPDVLWAQRKDSVYLTIDLKEVQDIKVKLEEDSLNFIGTVGGSTYEVSIDFSAPIVKEESKWSTKRLIEFYLKKKDAETWNHLRKQGKANWVKVDWKKWQDSDDEREASGGGFDLDGMGNMNFGDLAGGEQEFDSDDDDEDLPDLEPKDDEEDGKEDVKQLD
mmetsp:Transcript_32872/g.71743  ORF Transcript_32872/g.71743 Transcript_32872/m.71743 type:complete len:166 (+) Transcript_32872:70-567(+)|eukprot:CAMPEP_0170626544 /NCGR_PEP_ID=MMETSP0224-20130122/31417_1 /TAXON_ID=285029 /ORGANISM="Togula jolla, Strain CCCM 725" /LENGTH=165 /DNA_ID=CAMNT_0010953329 /DNA_START=65 /DNA_END=562 /DNA_ORIENTATION=-